MTKPKHKALDPGDVWSGVHNVYQAEVAALFGNANDFESHMNAFSARDELVRKYSWAIPNQHALDKLAALGKVLSVGAGNAYWAYLLRVRNGADVDVVATDLTPGRGNPYRNAQPFMTVVTQDGCEAVKRWPKHVPFLCWPPYGDSLALDVLNATPGDRFVVVGEWMGATGCDHFWSQLDDQWNHEVVDIPQWHGIHDAVYFCTRRASRESLESLESEELDSLTALLAEPTPDFNL